jgi:hypothetical protein
LKPATISEIKHELKDRSQKELIEFCLRLSKFKKENKELLTYLLFESFDENMYINNVKEEIDLLLNDINKSSYYYIKKRFRKILFTVKKYVRYSGKEQTEVELMIYFLNKMNTFPIEFKKNKVLKNMYERQYISLTKVISKLHEDLQYDYSDELKKISKFL